jgi:hypothetical protein
VWRRSARNKTAIFIRMEGKRQLTLHITLLLLIYSIEVVLGKKSLSDGFSSSGSKLLSGGYNKKKNSSYGSGGNNDDYYNDNNGGIIVGVIIGSLVW